MNLLVDNQLPAALARYLVDNGFGCRHVLDLGMETSDDREIWQLAKDEQLVIVTKDEDFALMADREGDAAPQVIWVRIGNCRKSALLAAFGLVLPDPRHLDLCFSSMPATSSRRSVEHAGVGLGATHLRQTSRIRSMALRCNRHRATQI
jgi:predicted nuclease of predicted toxin-antitoxin system